MILTRFLPTQDYTYLILELSLTKLHWCRVYDDAVSIVNAASIANAAVMSLMPCTLFAFALIPSFPLVQRDCKVNASFMHWYLLEVLGRVFDEGERQSAVLSWRGGKRQSAGLSKREGGFRPSEIRGPIVQGFEIFVRGSDLLNFRDPFVQVKISWRRSWQSTLRRHGLRCLLRSWCPTDLILASKKSNSNEKKGDQDRPEVRFIHEMMTQNLQKIVYRESGGMNA